MAISPWTLGDGLPTWTMALQPDSGPFSIAGLTVADFTLILVNSAGQSVVGVGTFSNLTAPTLNGQTVVTPATITYQVGAADVAMVGNYDLRVVVKRNTTSQRTFKFGNFSVQA